jgi:hypothetical protein
VPTRRTFDLALIVALLTRPAWGVVRMAARRWQREEQGVLNATGDAIGVLG